MKMGERVKVALDDAGQKKWLPALMHACAALDGTGKKLYPEDGSRDRFVKAFARYNWVIEPMLATGINIEATEFTWIQLDKRRPIFSEIIYEIFRCSLMHGDEIPPDFEIIEPASSDFRETHIGQQCFKIPTTLVYALLAAVVFCEMNASEEIGSDSWLSMGSMVFEINKWWGREDDAKICFSTVRQPRITLQFPTTS